MPDWTPFTKNQLKVILNEIEQAIYTPVGQLDVQAWCTSEPLPFAQRYNGAARTLQVGDKWGDLFDCAWFHFTGQVPPEAEGKKVVLLLDVNGELCVVNEYGMALQGLTTVASGYDFRLGRPGKRVLAYADCARVGDRISVWADGGCNDLFGNLQGGGALRQATIAVCDEGIRAFYYDWEVLLDLLDVLPPDSAQYHQTVCVLNDAATVLSQGHSTRVREARRMLAQVLGKRGGDPWLRISAVGHSHIDLAWLWPIRETIRKGVRTFATVIELMQRDPDYVFGASQPQLYQWVKERDPLLYAKVKKRVAEGRFEPQGAMWVEADTNLTGGESLVRQILHGRQFFYQEFGIEVNNLWLPDVFGYSAALPQILVKSGIRYFMTQKLSWSLINAFPHHSFHWQGIDGSRVLAHMLPEETYNSPAAPRSVVQIEKNYKDKCVSQYSLMLFGIGDGGGGPGEEHLERLSRIKNLTGLCPVTQEPAARFFERWAQEAARFPTWVGELYLERHQGTLTTQARSKWYNRKLELALRDWECSAVWAGLIGQTPYPFEQLNNVWRQVLLYQFHDILPGSSIKRVYDESIPRYQEMFQEAQEKTATNDALIAGQVQTTDMADPAVAFNSLPWPREVWLPGTNGWVCAQVPAMGYCAVEMDTPSRVVGLTATASRLENDRLIVTFDPDGAISSVWDKWAGREILVAGQAGNRLAVYDDHGDAWDFPMNYAERPPRYMALISARPRLEGPCAILEQTYQLGHSQVVQEIGLTAGSPRLDFVTRLTWREPRTMLHTSFTVDIHAEQATFEIQFGHLTRPTHRNTTWDLARDQVVAHKWVDLSQRDYGVALLNDSKYGHKVKGQTIDLNLLRSVPFPGPRLVRDEDVQPGEPHHAFTDQCEHQFVYALYPHTGDCAQGRVVQAAYELNVPVRVVHVLPQQGPLPPEKSFLWLDVSNIVIEAIKQAENGHGVIVRLYESEHRRTIAQISLGWEAQSAAETDLLEQDLAALPLNGSQVQLEFKPFEIKTLRIV